MYFFVMDESMVKRAMGARVKVFFQGLHMTHIIKFVLIYKFNFVF
jgi:hypothetical protein